MRVMMTYDIHECRGTLVRVPWILSGAKFGGVWPARLYCT